MNCPKCESEEIVKNGSIHTGAQKYRCKGCGRQFIANPQPHRISEATRKLVDQCLVERVSLAAIVRLTGVSKRWLQYYVNAKYARQVQEAVIRVKKKDG
jgi:insertion element IS1 protein InsB